PATQNHEIITVRYINEGGIFIVKITVKTLKKIEEDINKNDLGKARDRLHGLISTYPNELELRRRLGDIYTELKYPSMAGRYWYLEKNKTPEMVKACILFEKSMGNDPIRVARALKFKGDSEILKRLQLDQVISPIQDKVKETLLEEPEDPLNDKLIIFGCFSIIILTIIFALIGVYTILNWIF
ncbi:MAG: helicase, partial [Neobacillus sp.]|nr:helicase [Neobacillus sp.]